MAALFSFYDYHARNLVELAQVLVAWRRSNRGGYRRSCITSQRAAGGDTPVSLRQPRRLPRTLSSDQVLALVEACERLRDRFLAETGMRIGQALGLRHADFVSHRRELNIVPRPDNANGARAKTIEATTIPISAGLVRLYTAYMFERRRPARRSSGRSAAAPVAPAPGRTPRSSQTTTDAAKASIPIRGNPPPPGRRRRPPRARELPKGFWCAPPSSGGHESPIPGRQSLEAYTELLRGPRGSTICGGAAKGHSH
jgi:integrase